MSDEILGSLAKFTSRADMTDAVNTLSHHRLKFQASFTEFFTEILVFPKVIPGRIFTSDEISRWEPYHRSVKLQSVFRAPLGEVLIL